MPGAKPGVKLVFPGREKPGEAGSKAGDAGSKPGNAGNPGAGPKAGTPGISGSLLCIGVVHFNKDLRCLWVGFAF